MIKVEFKNLINGILVLLASIIVGTLLLGMAFMIPTDRIKSNILESMDRLNIETDYYDFVPGWHYTRIDNFTDATYLGVAAHDNGNKNAFVSAMYSYYPHGSGGVVDSLSKYLKNESVVTRSQQRYWNGYEIFVKPFFLMFNYDHFRVFNGFLIPCVALICVFLLIKRSSMLYGIAFMISYFGTFPQGVQMSISFSAIFYTTYISCLVMLLFHEKIKEKGLYIIFFELLGICTTYFNENLCYALPLGMTLLIYVILDQPLGTIKEILIKGMEFCISWGIGFVGMTSAKWIVGAIITKDKTMLNSITSVFSGISSSVYDVKISRFFAVLKNIVVYCENIVNIIMIFIFLISLFLIIRRCKRAISATIEDMFPYFAVVMIPLVWYMVVSSHTYIHSAYNYRSVAVCVFGLCSMFVRWLEIKQRSFNENNN